MSSTSLGPFIATGKATPTLAPNLVAAPTNSAVHSLLAGSRPLFYSTSVESMAGATELSMDLGEVLGFMRLLWAVAHGLNSASKQMQARMGITGPQRLVLRIIGHYQRISPGDLARVLQLHPARGQNFCDVADMFPRREHGDDWARAEA